jgi:hypothetical protein
LVVCGVLAAVSACSYDGDDDTSQPTSTSSSRDESSAVEVTAGEDESEGVVSVRFEPIGGIFIEGFAAAFRFELPTGEVIASTLWSDFVRSLEGESDTRDFYESVLEQPVPAGQVVLLATVNLGAGPPPEIPDPDGELDCRLELDVPAGGQVDVEVLFGSDCLRQI